MINFVNLGHVICTEDQNIEIVSVSDDSIRENKSRKGNK